VATETARQIEEAERQAGSAETLAEALLRLDCPAFVRAYVHTDHDGDGDVLTPWRAFKEDPAAYLLTCTPARCDHILRAALAQEGATVQ